MRYAAFFSFFILTLVLQSTAQSLSVASPLVLGEVRQLESKALGETRTLNIYLPQDYATADSLSYPVIYLLDGSANEDFIHIVGLVQFLNMYDLLPKTIVVGIANVDRYRDFTHPSKAKDDKEAIPNGGGSPKFIAFLANEAIPAIEKNYRVNGVRTIIGQSLGGLLATEILIKQPKLFQNYLIVSPSLWWGNQKLVKSAKDYFAENLELEARVFVSLGKEHPVMHKTADKLVKAMQESGNTKLACAYQPILEEDHATILHKAAYEGLEWLFPKASKE